MRLATIVSILCLTLGAACGGGDDTREPPPPEPTPQPIPEPEQPSVVDVTIHDDFFDPADITVTAGTVVRWTSVGDDEHSVTSGDTPAASDAGTLFDMDLETGDVFEVTFDSPGVQPYFCKYHFFVNGMSGTVTVE